MSEFINIAGQTYGEWTAVSYASNGKWACRCSCGALKTIEGASLRGSKSRSCQSCARRANPHRRTHGASGSKLYQVWLGMRRRCLNEGDGAYARYGGRGITVCAEWANSFETFRQWAETAGYAVGLTLDRRNNDGPYSPDNCRWATYAQQNRNYSRTRMVEFEGKTVPVIDLAERFGIKPHTLRQRIFRYGWTVERAISFRVVKSNIDSLKGNHDA